MMTHIFSEEVYMSKDLTQWVSGVYQLIVCCRVFDFTP